MSTAFPFSLPDRRLDRKILTLYLLAAGLFYVAVVGYLVGEGKRIPSMIALGAPALLYLITQPRLALYSFIFLVTIKNDVMPSIPITAADIGALLLIASAGFDFLLNSSAEVKFPPLTVNYLSLLGILVVAGIFGYSFSLSLHPIARILLLFLTFLALHHALSRVSLIKPVKFFFWLVAAHSVIAFGQFAANGGHIRSFGLIQDMLDDFTMITLPVGVALFLWERQKGMRYLIGSMITLAGLVATQSRAPMLFAALAVIIVFWVSRRRATQPDHQFVRRRIRTFLFAAAGLAALALVLKPGLFGAFTDRFQRLITTTPGDTFRLRLVIWSRALSVFAAHPLLGLGPGTFRFYSDIFPSAHLDSVGYYIRSLSAHNLTLHYLAETGLTGTVALLALFVNVFRKGRSIWIRETRPDYFPLALALFIVATLFMYTTPLEAGWMWGETSYAAVFFFGLIARGSQQLGGQQENT